MNSSQSSTINFTGAVDACADKPKSPCEAAYDRLSRAQERLKDAIGSLHGSLALILRDTKPAEQAGNVTVVDESPQSEIHGRFLAAARRTEALVEHVEQILSQVTV